MFGLNASSSSNSTMSSDGDYDAPAIPVASLPATSAFSKVRLQAPTASAERHSNPTFVDYIIDHGKSIQYWARSSATPLSPVLCAKATHHVQDLVRLHNKNIQPSVMLPLECFVEILSFLPPPRGGPLSKTCSIVPACGAHGRTALLRTMETCAIAAYAITENPSIIEPPEFQPACPNGHELTLQSNKAIGGSLICDVCDATAPKEACYGCRRCDYDICSTCMKDKKAQFLSPPAVLFHPADTCSNGHKLTDLRGGNLRYGSFASDLIPTKCSVCLNSLEKENLKLSATFLLFAAASKNSANSDFTSLQCGVCASKSCASCVKKRAFRMIFGHEEHETGEKPYFCSRRHKLQCFPQLTMNLENEPKADEINVAERMWCPCCEKQLQGQVDGYITFRNVHACFKDPGSDSSTKVNSVDLCLLVCNECVKYGICPRGHILQPGLRSAGTYLVCDGCSLRFTYSSESATPTASCASCDFDLCGKCQSDKCNPQMRPEKLIPEMKCPRCMKSGNLVKISCKAEAQSVSCLDNVEEEDRCDDCGIQFPIVSKECEECRFVACPNCLLAKRTRLAESHTAEALQALKGTVNEELVRKLEQLLKSSRHSPLADFAAGIVMDNMSAARDGTLYEVVKRRFCADSLFEPIQ